MIQVSKKDLCKKKGRLDCGHLEGKYWCNCRTRNYRKWLGIKLKGREDGQTDT